MGFSALTSLTGGGGLQSSSSSSASADGDNTFSNGFNYSPNNGGKSWLPWAVLGLVAVAYIVKG